MKLPNIAPDSHVAGLADGVSRLNDAVTATAAARQKLERAITEEIARRRALEGKLAQAEASNQSAEQRRLAEAAASADKLTRQQAEFSSILAEAVRARDTLAQRMNDALEAIEQARQDRAADAEAAAEQLAQRESTLISKLEDAATTQARLERSLLDTESALRDAEQRLADVTLELQRVEGQAAAERETAAEDATRRQGEYAVELARAETARQALEKALDAAAAALRATEQKAQAERQSAAEQAAQSQSTFETELQQEIAERQAVEGELAKMRATSEQARLSFLSQLEDAATTQARLEQCLSNNDSALRDAEQRLADATLSLARVEQQAAADQQALEKALAAANAALRSAEQRAEADRQSATEEAAQSQARFETELTNEITRHQSVERELAEARQHGSRLEERAARERAEWESTQAEDRERIQQLQIEGDLARRALAAAEDQIRRQQTAHGEERANLECARLALEADLACQRTRLEGLVAERDTRLKTLTKELEAARSQRDALKTTAGLVPKLREQLENIRAENRDQFDNAPVNMCRLNRAGATTRINQAMANLLGYDTPEEAHRIDFGTAVFESADEVPWLVDRCLASRSIESVETPWRRKDGSRLIVRVQAVATTAASIDLTAHDMTTFRELEEKLRYARRLEAVARYASEVAVNCDGLLGHVKEDGEQWLASLENEAARRQGELLLAEVARAARLLKQLGACGNEQKRVSELVEVNKVLRDMAPVLKQVAGSNIELVLPKGAPPLNLDVEAERVERMLVNVAAYGRERMPLGGRMTIDVTSVVVDRNFVSKYPNVRPGPHVLLTVNELRGTVPPPALRTHTLETNTTAADNPGVDLGALQTLVSDCGGHLWMMAEPPGDMVLKIHLPRRVLDHANPPSGKRLAGSKWISRLPGIRH